ncbi:taurine catabolism dioxygenase taud/tfda [Fusarium flagelliforme]|uniref:Taurine catabolism dioxygenase taud/tfda n=1 Tax=Fusarium flagelliforme TaxID=2675880 RepID=A0A395MGE0_9HYPO|nr:taurine catabolism dioxygenase taud/tfda [Fusarium flagelliforme]
MATRAKRLPASGLPFKRAIEEPGASSSSPLDLEPDETNNIGYDSSSAVSSTINTASLRPQTVQYPNPGYLGSSSHTTLFDQLRRDRSPQVTEAIAEPEKAPSPQRDYINDTSVSSGANLILELHRLSKIPAFIQLYQSWSATGTNLALAGPFIDACASTVESVMSLCDGSLSRATALSQNLFNCSSRPIIVEPNTSFDEYCKSLGGGNARWETLGLFFVAVCRAAVDLPFAEPLYNSEQERRKFQRLTLRYSDHCLEQCLPLDCMNDLQLFLQYENFISHSQIDGDQSYQSWRKLGDVISSLFALGYHQQQTESFNAAPDFLRDLRRLAFCRTYSADKNVSIFLGRPPRITRRFCRFFLPGNHLQPSEEASRKPQIWDPSQGPSFITDSRWAALCGIMKEDILGLLSQQDHEEKLRQGLILQEDIQEQWEAVPEQYRLQGSLKGYSRRPVERDFMLNMKLNYLHVKFLLRLTLQHSASDPDPQLLAISIDLLSLVVEAVMLKDQLINSGTSLVWKVAYYGLSAAGVICLRLVNQSSSLTFPQANISKVFQDLSILVAEIERGTLVYVDSPNYALLARATQIIKSLLDRVISSSFKTGTIVEPQQQTAENAEQWSALNDTNLGLWDNSGLQDFETNFWLNLADHPFLAEPVTR